ncbi:radical SAM protein [Thermodesulfobacteriota bacterium]
MKVSRRDFIKGSILFSASLFLSKKPWSSAKSVEAGDVPGYAKLEKAGVLGQRIEQAHAVLNACQLCPRRCGVNRLNGDIGFCRSPDKVTVYTAQPHFGEEISLTGQKGSGTIFFSNCNLRCVFCQNWPIAHEGRGKKCQDDELAEMMLYLQEIGCHNINLVTPTHVMPHILNATRIALKQGLHIPLVYNTSGYERTEILEILDGIVDIYLPDMKYMHAEMSAKYSAGASDYPEVAKAAIVEMHRQVGLHQTDRRGIATKGLMIRHLVMPERIAGTLEFVRWVAQTLPRSTYVNIMSQYHAAYRAFEFPELSRGTTAEEFLEAMHWAEESGLTHIDPRAIAIRNIYSGGR